MEKTLRLLRGIVVNNKSPDHDGRVQVFLPTLYEDAKLKDQEFLDNLPWSEIMAPLYFKGLDTEIGNQVRNDYLKVKLEKSNQGRNVIKPAEMKVDDYLDKDSGQGICVVPQVGATVFCFLEDDDDNRPIVIGSVIGEQQYTNISSPDNSNTLHTTSGHLIEIDDTKDNERIHIHHKSGTDIEIQHDGTVDIGNAKDVNIITLGNISKFCNQNVDSRVKGNKTLNIEKDYNRTCNQNTTETTFKDRKQVTEGNLNIQTNQNVTENTKGNHTETIDGNHNERISGTKSVKSGTCTFNCDGATIRMSGGKIFLN